MAEKKEKEGQVSMTSTKKEMLEAYNALLKELKEKSEIKPEKRVEEKRAEEVTRVASSLSTEGVVKGISSLKLEIGKLLTEISDRMEEEVNRFKDIQEAIEVKEKGLQEIYEIEKSVQTLTTLIEAQNRKREEFECEMAQKREDLSREIQKTKEAWEEEKKRREGEAKEQEVAERKKRDREQEEFRYNFNREEQLAKDQLEDEKLKLKREFQTEKEEKEKELADKEKALAEREEEMNQLRKKVEIFPKELETALNKAVKETTEKVQKEEHNSEELLKREFAGEKNVLLVKIESLERTVTQQEIETTKLSKQLESAYRMIEDLAVKTVTSAPGWKPGYQQEEGKKEGQK